MIKASDKPYTTPSPELSLENGDKGESARMTTPSRGSHNATQVPLCSHDMMFYYRALKDSTLQQSWWPFLNLKIVSREGSRSVMIAAARDLPYGS